MDIFCVINKVCIKYLWFGKHVEGMNGSRWESFFGGDEEPGEVSKKKQTNRWCGLFIEDQIYGKLSYQNKAGFGACFF